jgi:hypothetical protein
MDNLTLTFREKTLNGLVTFLTGNANFADVLSILSEKSGAAAALGANVPVPVTLPSDRANALFELISETLASLSAVPEQSEAWQVLSLALETT